MAAPVSYAPDSISRKIPMPTQFGISYKGIGQINAATILRFDPIPLSLFSVDSDSFVVCSSNSIATGTSVQGSCY